MRTRACVSLLLALAAPAAAQTLSVEGVVSPAWVERGGQRQPVFAGMRLDNKDRVATGAGSRLLLRLADGSAVKLGETAGHTFPRPERFLTCREILTASTRVFARESKTLMFPAGSTRIMNVPI